MIVFRSLERYCGIFSPGKIVYSYQDSRFFGQCEQMHDVVVVVDIFVVVVTAVVVVVVVFVIFTLTSFILGLSFRNSLSPISPLMMAENSENVT